MLLQRKIMPHYAISNCPQSALDSHNNHKNACFKQFYTIMLQCFKHKVGRPTYHLAVTNFGVCGVGACGFWRYRMPPVSIYKQEVIKPAYFQVYCGQVIAGGVPSVVADHICVEKNGPKPATSQPCGREVICPTWHIGPWKPVGLKESSRHLTRCGFIH